MMQSKQIFILALAACLAVIVSSEDESKGEEYEDWKPNHYRIFATKDAEPIKPSETLDLLISLHSMYTGRTDSGSKTRLPMVDELIEISNMDYLEKCDNERVTRQLNYLIGRYSMYKVTLMPYLKCNAKKLYKRCQMAKELQELGEVEGCDKSWASKFFHEKLHI